MFSRTFAIKVLNELSIRSASVVSSVSRKYFINQSKFSSHNSFVGYTQKSSIQFRYPCNWKRVDISRREFSSPRNTNVSTERELDAVQFEKISGETLDSLTEYFDELVDQAAHLQDADVSYGDGVLTVKFGEHHGTYVINRQTPNKQIWLSSPKSGPKRYDYNTGQWIYKHDGQSLHQLLDDEIAAVVNSETTFRKLLYGRSEDTN